MLVGLVFVVACEMFMMNGYEWGSDFLMNKVLEFEFPPTFVDVACKHGVGGTRNLLLGYACE
jgi:hypothetical protein